jgi:hypothetical protein
MGLSGKKRKILKAANNRFVFVKPETRDQLGSH